MYFPSIQDFTRDPTHCDHRHRTSYLQLQGTGLCPRNGEAPASNKDEEGLLRLALIGTRVRAVFFLQAELKGFW